MKKVFYLVAVATLVFLSCQRIDEDATPQAFTFKASIENFATKADMNDANQLVWAEGDKIGIYVDDDSWETKNQPFTLSAGANTPSGTFEWDYGPFSNQYAAAAFFPWEGQGSGYNNAYYQGDGDGLIMYFKLRDSYDGYTSGRMLTPLISKLETSSSPIQFKHAGAAVKVTINNLPAGAHSIGMTVADQQVFGDYHINPAYAGTDALTPDETADLSKNTVWLNYAPAETARKFTFIFPVPELTKPKLSFQIWDKNGILVWSKKLKAQTSDLGRADVLVMPATDITPYSQFNTVSEDWYFCGSINEDDWTNDILMITDGRYCILGGVTFKAGNKFKIRKNQDDPYWGEAYPSSDWVVTEDYAGLKTVIFDTTTKAISVVNATDCPYPTYPY